MAIIRASYELPPAGKLVIGLCRQLDRGDGAFLAPAQAAAELGMGQRYFEEVRAGLVRLGLMVQVIVQGSRLDFWFPRLPPEFPMEPPPDSSQEERRRWVRQWADELDRLLERGKPAGNWYRPERGKPAPSPYTERGKPAQYSAGNPRSPDPLSAGLTHSDRGKPALTEHESTRSGPPTVTVKALTTQGLSQSPTPPDSDTERARSKKTTAAEQPDPDDLEATRRAYREMVRMGAEKNAGPSRRSAHAGAAPVR